MEAPGWRKNLEFVARSRDLLNLLVTGLRGYVGIGRTSMYDDFIHWIRRAHQDCTTPNLLHQEDKLLENNPSV